MCGVCVWSVVCGECVMCVCGVCMCVCACMCGVWMCVWSVRVCACETAQCKNAAVR